MKLLKRVFFSKLLTFAKLDIEFFKQAIAIIVIAVTKNAIALSFKLCQLVECHNSH